MTFPPMVWEWLRSELWQETVNFYWGIHLKPLAHPSLIVLHCTAWAIPSQDGHLSWYLGYHVLLSVTMVLCRSASLTATLTLLVIMIIVFTLHFQLSAATYLASMISGSSHARFYQGAHFSNRVSYCSGLPRTAVTELLNDGSALLTGMFLNTLVSGLSSRSFHRTLLMGGYSGLM